MNAKIERYGYIAEILLDSFVRIKGKKLRITSFKLRVPRMILSEFNTHRAISRNSASSRAIPGWKMRQFVRKTPFVPDRFPKDHSGMQANEWVLSGTFQYRFWKALWLTTMYILVGLSALLNRVGISKQLTNRIVEAVLWHDILATATDWDNFFALRAEKSAQNEIRIIAEMMLEAMNSNVPKEVNPGEWHLPFGDQISENKLQEVFQELSQGPEPSVGSINELTLMIVIARCARVSYRNFKGPADYRKDVELFNQLLTSGHWSAFEHAARAMTEEEYEQYTHTGPGWIEYGRLGNFCGWIQYRRTVPRDTENRIEPRLIKDWDN